MPGMIYLKVSDPSLSIGLSLRGAVQPGAGYGVWNKVARPFDKPITEWTNSDALSLPVSFLIDVELGMNVEATVANLELLAGLDADDQPATFKIAGDPPGVLPHDAATESDRDWFIESLTWDADEAITEADGSARRRAGDMVLTEFVADETLAALKRKKAKKPAQKIRKDRYTVKKGDTLNKIAAKLKVKGGWKALAKLNGIRDPKKLKVGSKLKVPK